jgi:hypothetical protein
VPGDGAVAAGTIDPAGATTVELVASTPTVAFRPSLVDGRPVSARVRLRNVTRRPLVLTIAPEQRTRSGVTVSASPGGRTLRAGAEVDVRLTAEIRNRPRAPGALTGVLRIRIRAGGVLRVPWAIAFPATDRPLLDGVRLSAARFAPSDVRPVVLSLVAGRVDGSIERPQLLPLETLTIDLYRGRRNLGRLVDMRDVLPGRYAFGLTGRGPRGARLASAAYELAIVATPVGGGVSEEQRVSFRIR